MLPWWGLMLLGQHLWRRGPVLWRTWVPARLWVSSWDQVVFTPRHDFSAQGCVFTLVFLDCRQHCRRLSRLSVRRESRSRSSTYSSTCTQPQLCWQQPLVLSTSCWWFWCWGEAAACSSRRFEWNCTAVSTKVGYNVWKGEEGCLSVTVFNREHRVDDRGRHIQSINEICEGINVSRACFHENL